MRTLAAAAAALALAACGNFPLMPAKAVFCSDSATEVAYEMAQDLSQAVKAMPGRAFVVLPLSDLDEGGDAWAAAKTDADIKAFGRMFADQLTSGFVRQGVAIVDSRGLRTKEAAAKAGAYGYASGSYTRMGGKYYINVKLVRLEDGAVLSSVDACYTYKTRKSS
ncbi:MAG: hypothetical protein D4R84_07625 [Rhodocyclaceae bacterium]|nr:MAG: hypothetical protein D4R84_07625 [Rhodocyclaceae bacterium]